MDYKKENERLKNKIIELQAEIIRLKNGVIPRAKEIKIIEREIIREKDWEPWKYPTNTFPRYMPPTTGDPMPMDEYITIC